jgi:hypothetical protein
VIEVWDKDDSGASLMQAIYPSPSPVPIRYAPLSASKRAHRHSAITHHLRPPLLASGHGQHHPLLTTDTSPSGRSKRKQSWRSPLVTAPALPIHVLSAFSTQRAYLSVEACRSKVVEFWYLTRSGVGLVASRLTPQFYSTDSSPSGGNASAQP